MSSPIMRPWRSSASTGCTATCTSLVCSMSAVWCCSCAAIPPATRSCRRPCWTDQPRVHRGAVPVRQPDQRSPVVAFAKGQRNDHTRPSRVPDRFEEPEGVLFVGRAQDMREGVPHRETPEPDHGATYPAIARTTAMVNHFYVYVLDTDFGPFFIKFCSDSLTTPSCAQRQRVGQTPSGQGRHRLRSARQRLRDVRRAGPAATHLRPLGLGPHRPVARVNGWPGCRTPSPPRDRRAGYRYDLSILQAESPPPRCWTAPPWAGLFR